MTLQAERLGRALRPMGNVAPREGGTVQTGGRDEREMRDYARALFGTDPY